MGTKFARHALSCCWQHALIERKHCVSVIPRLFDCIKQRLSDGKI
jgi:hypothetical protein